MRDHKIIIFPVDPTKPVPAYEHIEHALVELGCIVPKKAPLTFYKPGPKFQHLIEFRRFHVRTVLDNEGEIIERSDSRKDCWIEIPAITNEIKFLGSDRIAEAAQCPNCGYVNTGWQQMIADWHRDKMRYHWSCPECQIHSTPWELDWKHTTGFGRFSVEIWELSLQDAIPRSDFLKSFATQLQQEVDYCYYAE